MKIQYLNGGLANQVFQYIFYRYAQLESEHPEEWFLDDTFFYFRDEHNGYELEKVFGIKPNLLSQLFDPEGWEVFVSNRKKNIGTADTIAALGFDVVMVSEASNYKNDNPFQGTVHEIPCNEYHPEILNADNEVVYYFGYWINLNWFKKYKDILKKELTFPCIVDNKNKKYLEDIENSFSVGIHIRRGDYVTHGWNIGNDFYLQSTKVMLENHPQAHFFIFSDDPDWCEDNAENLGLDRAVKTVFVRGNVNGKNYIDLRLLSMCKGMILSNSAFCYLAALLDDKLECFTNPNQARKIW